MKESNNTTKSGGPIVDTEELMIEFLKQKQVITSLEKDILDTYHELQKFPFDANSAEQKIISNNINYPKIALKVAALPSTVQKTTEVDLRYILSCQLAGLVEQEREVIKHGQ